MAVVSKTCFGSPPGPLRIKPECSSGTVMQKHRKDGWMDGREEKKKKEVEKSRMKTREKKEDRERQTHKKHNEGLYLFLLRWSLAKLIVASGSVFPAKCTVCSIQAGWLLAR